jgi:hypothetical protein
MFEYRHFANKVACYGLEQRQWIRQWGKIFLGHYVQTGSADHANPVQVVLRDLSGRSM